MSLPPSNPPLKTIPVAQPARRGLVIPAVEVGERDDAVEVRSPWDWHGWGWSIGVHALLLLILALWVFAPPAGKVQTFDTRLAGSELGAVDGLKTLGGLDTPVTLPDAVQAPTENSTLERMKPIELADPTAGFAGNPTNPGAGQGDGFGLAKFGSGGETVRGVEVKVGDPQFTLLWDTTADIDLHVFEPGGKEIYWNDTKGRQGGELDVDNVDGFGPENIYWLKESADGSKDIGPGPPGVYRWFVLYYGGNRGFPVATRWKVRIKHEGRVETIQGRLTVPKSRSQIYTLKVGDPSSATSTPSPVASPSGR